MNKDYVSTKHRQHDRVIFNLFSHDTNPKYVKIYKQNMQDVYYVLRNFYCTCTYMYSVLTLNNCLLCEVIYISLNK